MGLNNKERRELIIEIEHKYKDKRNRWWEKGVTIGDISRDMRHSDKREIADVSRQIVEEGK